MSNETQRVSSGAKAQCCPSLVCRSSSSDPLNCIYEMASSAGLEYGYDKILGIGKIRNQDAGLKHPALRLNLKSKGRPIDRLLCRAEVRIRQDFRDRRN